MTSAPDSPQARDHTTLVVGMGNPVLGDDAVGWRVVEELQRRLDGRAAASGGAQDRRIQTDCLALGGLRLMERLVGYDRAIVVDAIVTGERPPGFIAWGELPAAAAQAAPTHTGSAHDVTLETALRLGRALGASLPSEILVLAIEAGPCFEFGEELSPPVAAAVPRAVDLLLRELRAGIGPVERVDRRRIQEGEHRHWNGQRATDKLKSMASVCVSRTPRGGTDG